MNGDSLHVLQWSTTNLKILLNENNEHTNFMLMMRLFKRSYALLSLYTNHLEKTTPMQADLVKM